MKKSFLLLITILMLLAGYTQAAVQRKAPMLVYSEVSDCCYAWVVYDSGTSEVLGKGVYCDPNCTESILTRSTGPVPAPIAPTGKHKTDLEGQLMREAKAALPSLEIEKIMYRPSRARKIVEGMRVGSQTPLPAESAQALAALPAPNKAKAGACAVKECAVFPNPVEEVLTLKFVYDCTATGGKVGKEATIAATSNEGGQQFALWQGSLNQENTELAIPVAKLPAGLYTLQVHVGIFEKDLKMQKL